MGRETCSVRHTIAERFYQSDQSWYYEWVGSLYRRRYKVTIRRNAYDEQSYLRGYVFDQSSANWNLLVSRPIQGATCADTSYCGRADKAPFVQDAESVLDELQQIVTGDQHDG